MIQWTASTALRFLDWLARRREKRAIKVLLESTNITMLAFKDRDCGQIFMAAAPSDAIGFAFYARNMDEVENPSDSDSLLLERIYHSPDANKGD